VTEQGPVASVEQDLPGTSAPSTETPPLSAHDKATTRTREAIADEKAPVGKVSCQVCRRWCDPWIRHAPLSRRRSGARRKSRRGRDAALAALANINRPETKGTSVAVVHDVGFRHHKPDSRAW
jgi:hypothetical protein